MNTLKIVFMGTPDFAVGILNHIVSETQHQVVGVVTVADKPAGRGQKMNESAVKKAAQMHQLPILQPTNLKDEQFIEDLKALQANLFVVVAFRMLPKIVWELPQLGTFNLHASLLPNYRGAAPINWAIINGESETGVTTFFIDEKIDTGAIILQEKIKISEEDSAGSLHDKLMHLGAHLVSQTLDVICKNEAVTTAQPPNLSFQTAYKLNKDNCKIDWNVAGMKIYNQIRGLSPYPAAWCYFVDNDEAINVKIYKAKFETVKHQEKTGKAIHTKQDFKIAVQDGYIHVLELQLPGKKRMTYSALANGVVFSENLFVQ